MASAGRRRALRVWATLVYWTGKAAGALVVEARGRADGRHEFVAAGGRRRAWNVACLAAAAYRIRAQTWPVTARAADTAQATCYDTVCGGGVWCVYACVYYAVVWLDRTLEIGALLAAATWRRRSTAACLNSAAAVCFDDDDDGVDGDERRPSAADVPWHAYLTVAFPVVHFATVANVLPSARDGVWHAAAVTVAAVASCAPVAAHGTAVALLIVANNGMRSINHRVTRLSRCGRRRLDHDDHDDHDDRRRRAVVVRLARRHWATTELVTGGVCHAYGVDLMAAVLLAAVRVTYVAISVFHRLTDDGDAVAAQDFRTNVSLAVVVQLIAWFGQFAYLAYTCDELTAQSSEMFDNLNSLLLDIFDESRLAGEKYSSTLHEIEAVQEFMRQVVARKVIVHACCGLITLNLSLITTIIGVTLTYLIVLLQFESSYHGVVRNDTIVTQ